MITYTCRHGNDQVSVHIYSEPAFKVFNLVCLHTTDQWPCQAGVKANTLRPRQNGRHFADDIFKRNFLNENIWITIKISLKFVPKGPINNIPALVQIMAWRRSGDKPLSEPMMINLLTHICITRPQWVDSSAPGISREISTAILNVRSSICSHWKPEKINKTWKKWSYF